MSRNYYSRIHLHLIIATVVATASWADAGEAESQDRLPAIFASLLPLHTKLGPPRPGEWLDAHKEPGQSYAQYLSGRPMRVDRTRRVIYVQPLGKFDAARRKVLDRTAEFLGIYFQLPVKVRAGLVLGPDSGLCAARAPDLARQADPLDLRAGEGACGRACPATLVRTSR